MIRLPLILDNAITLYYFFDGNICLKCLYHIFYKLISHYPFYIFTILHAYKINVVGR